MCGSNPQLGKARQAGKDISMNGIGKGGGFFLAQTFKGQHGYAFQGSCRRGAKGVSRLAAVVPGPLSLNVGCQAGQGGRGFFFFFLQAAGKFLVSIQGALPVAGAVQQGYQPAVLLFAQGVKPGGLVGPFPGFLQLLLFRPHGPGSRRLLSPAGSGGCVPPPATGQILARHR
ncbi:hypothetical protein ADICEAN_02906 [Cesiribacter andamanensis AMV16]|uniref:Uncharacterized protein n=1 Tax=Cesiribacter andamanensis AMV16 TaxID=1279009 RepID=M7N430_9BACT|nr:hypothetical protein ADICEAN_02906 [Cesiribacter andamanensis AMV16]